MHQFAENIGWYLFLGIALSVSLYASKAFLRFVLDKGAEGEPVYGTDVLILASKHVFDLVSKMMLATCCAVAVLFSVGFLTSASWFAALGYASFSLLIGGLLTPRLMKEITPSVDTSVAHATEDKSSTGPD